VSRALQPGDVVNGRQILSRVSPSGSDHARYLSRCLSCGAVVECFGYRLKRSKCRGCRKPPDCGVYAKYQRGCRCEKCRAANSENEKKRRATPHGRRSVRNSQLKTKFGIDINQFESMCSAQGGLCAICGEGDKPLCVDHSHDSGMVRGILCKQCNAAIGLLGDSSACLRRAAEYLEIHERNEVTRAYPLFCDRDLRKAGR